jgi:hypothetical protein
VSQAVIKFPKWQIDEAVINFSKDIEAKKVLRFGQWFCNTYDIREDQFLFYVRDTKEAYNHILDNYLIEV